MEKSVSFAFAKTNKADHPNAAMTNANLLSLFWKGFTIKSFHPVSEQTLIIELKPDDDLVPQCSGCHRKTSAIHDVHIRQVRERDLFQYRVFLKVPVRRLRCPGCGPCLEFISWLPGRRHLTTSLVNWVETLVRLMPVAHVAELVGLHWHTVKAIDYTRLQREVVEPDKRSIRRLIMDEFALFKGHRYATVVIDADTQQVLWVGEGRSRVAIRPFFEWLGYKACHQIEAVAMDMNTAMDLEVQQHCPKARVIYDLFHVVAKFGREVIDRVRVDEANRLKHNQPARRVVKQSRWLLLRNKQNLGDQQRVKLDELLAVNQSLMTTYLLKDQLKALWYAPDEQQAIQRWQEWFAMAMESGIAPVIQFARRLKGYADGIIASANFRLNTSVLEGMNNKIKVIKRMAYGFRDTQYFFLKIKAAFPGKVR